MPIRVNHKILITILMISWGCGLPTNTDPPALPPPTSYQGPDSSAVLLYNGASAWPAEVDSLASILYQHQVSYLQVSSVELDAMPMDHLLKYSLLVVPGGDAPTVTNSLSAMTHARLREAVQLRGLNYLGFCAGAWLAVAPAPEQPGEDVTYGIGLVDGPKLQQTYLYKEGKPYALSKASFPDGSMRDLLWYGGPVTPDLPGSVVARYADGTPAISQIHSGKGFVIISGLHPAATPAIMSSLGLNSSESVAPELTWRLMEAGIRNAPLPAF